MSKTLSANVTAGKVGSSTVVWLLEIESNLKTYYLATSTFVDGAITYSGSRILKKSLGKASYKCDLSLGGNVVDVGDFSFKLTNGDLYSDNLAMEYFENRRVELRLIFSDQTSPSWANATRCFYGTIEKVGDWTLKEIPFSCKGKWKTPHLNIVRKQALQSKYYFLPDNNEGKYFGLVYGDFQRSGINRNGIAYSGLTSSPYQFRDYILGFMIKKQTSGSLFPQGWLGLAEHQLKSQLVSGDALRITRWNDKLKLFTQVDFDTDNTTTLWFNDGVSTSLRQSIAGFDWNVFYVSGTAYERAYIIPKPDEESSSATGISSIKNATNEVVTDRVSLTAAATVIYFRSEIYEDDGFSWNSVKIYLERDGDETVAYEISCSGCTTLTGTISTFGSTVSITLTGSGWDSGTIIKALTRSVTIKLTSTLVGGAYNNVYVKHVHIAVVKQVQSSSVDDELLQSVQGRMYGGWIDAPNHSTSKNAGDLIESPAGIIESILCDELELTCEKLKGAADFDGTTSIAVSHSETLTFSSGKSFTMMCWVYLDNHTGGNGILRKCNLFAGSIANGVDWYIDSSGNPVLATGDGTNESVTTGTSAVSTGVWTHVAVVWDASGGQVYHYINGVAAGSGSPLYRPTDGGASKIIEIGSHAGASGANSRFDGGLDELVIVSVALNSSKVAGDYNGGNGVYHTKDNTSNLLAVWHFDEMAGAEFHDRSGNMNHGGLLASYNTVPSFRTGKVESPQKIVESSFDTVQAARSSWKLARHFKEPINSRDAIKEICYEGACAYQTRSDGLESCHIFTGNGAPSTITRSKILKARGSKETTFRVTRSKLVDIKNEFILEYHQNAVTGEFDKVLFIKNPGAQVYSSNYTNLSVDGLTYWNICHTSFVNYKQVNTWRFQAKNIRDDATAELFIKFMVDWLAPRRYGCEFEAPLDLIDLELFDQRKISHDLLPSAISGIDRFVLSGIETDPVTDRLKLTWIDCEVASVLPTSLAVGADELKPSFWVVADDFVSAGFVDGDGLHSVMGDLWYGRDENGRNVNCANGDPLLRTDPAYAMNGHAVLSFDGANDYLDGDGGFALSDIMSDTRKTIFIVCQIKLISSNDATLVNNEALIATTVSDDFGLYLKTAPTSNMMNNDGAEAIASITTDTLENMLLTLHHDGESNITVKKNNGTSAVTATATSNATADITDTIRIGSNTAKSAYFNGYIAEIIIYNAALTSDEQTLVCDYLNRKYALY